MYEPLFCRDGQSRAGVYCGANACIEQVIQHGEVDVFQAAKTVRRHRPQLVENIVCIIFLMFPAVYALLYPLFSTFILVQNDLIMIIRISRRIVYLVLKSAFKHQFPK